MLNKQKLPAFTIPEILTTLVLSGIISVFIYHTFFMVNKWFVDYRERQDKYEQLHLFQYLFNRDLVLSQNIKLESANEVVCEYAQGRVSYRFERDQIIRTQGAVSDTLHANVDDTSFYFNGNRISSPGLLIDEIGFKIYISDNDYLEYLNYKIYDCANLVFSNQNQ